MEAAVWMAEIIERQLLKDKEREKKQKTETLKRNLNYKDAVNEEVCVCCKPAEPRRSEAAGCRATCYYSSEFERWPRCLPSAVFTPSLLLLLFLLLHPAHLF